MSTNRADDRYSESDDEGAHRPKRRKGPKACDVCRRKKIRCDPDPSGDPQRPCVNCAVFKTECTFTYIAKKRRTQQAYIDGLQDRLQKVEKLLTSLAPEIDLSKELDDSGDISRLISTASHTSPVSRPQVPSPPKPVPLPPNPDVNPGQVVAAFTEWREPETSEEDDEEEDLTFIPWRAGPSTESPTESVPHRFHGKSSGVMLLSKVMGMKRVYTGDSPAPKDFAIEEPWETKVHTTLDPIVTFKFPPKDLQDHLIDVFFRCVNPYLPIFHRPSFDALVRDGLHTRDPPFGAVLLLLFAVASRWSHDPRVLSTTHPDTERMSSWSSAGWDFYFEVQMRYRRNFLHTTSVRDLQMIALGCVYLQGSSNPSPSWHMAGLGLRLALDVGAHRRKRPDSGSRMENETWKRAFWVLVVLDRMSSAFLGRPCAIWEEDIDLDLPLEVDDEYMTEEAGFKQPPDKPSYIAYFNSLVKLTQILIGALRTIYPISKNKSMFRVVGPGWEQDMVAALDSALNSWLDSIPTHLHWDPHRAQVDTTFYQAGIIHCCHHYVHIVVHRPYITSSRSPSALAFPSLALCTNAARSCAHILSALRRRGSLCIPMLDHAAFASAIVLLFNIWGMNRPGARVDWQSQVQDVHACMRYIEKTKGRWQHSQKMGTILRDLVCVGEFPLPQGNSPPFAQGASPPFVPSPPFAGGQKRARDSDGSHASTPAPSSVDRAYAPEGMGYGESEARPFRQDAYGYAQAQGYYHARSSSGAGDALSLALPAPQQGQSQNVFAYGQADVLSAFDSAYLVDGAASLGDGIVMDVAQHALDVWGTAPTGFQWDEWQQFANVVQGAPAGGYAQGGQ